MKMKEVLETTGLTEKAVRLYIEHGLVKPEIEQGLHNRSFEFSEEDVKQLSTISVLRNAGLSIADIRFLQEHPDQIPAYLEEHKRKMTENLRKAMKLETAIETLTPDQRGNLDALAGGLARAVEPLEPETAGDRHWGLVIGATVLLILALAAGVLGQTRGRGGILTMMYAFVAVCFVGAFGGLVSCFMSVRYATAPWRARRLSQHYEGRVISVMLQTGYSSSYSIGSTATIGGPRWGGNGGIWALAFMVWNEIRPDHWYPLIQFRDANGKIRALTLPYGTLRNTYREGDSVSFAMTKDGYQALPLEGAWLKKKAVIYFVCGLAVIVILMSLYAHYFPVLLAEVNRQFPPKW